MSRKTPIPPGYCAYLTRKLPIDLRDRLHALVRAKRQKGIQYNVEDVVNCALEIGVTLMEQDAQGRKN